MSNKNTKNSINKDTFGERLRKSRKANDLSQAGLANRIGYKRGGSISNIEADKTPPDIQTLIKIAEILNADLHWLITGNPAPYNEQRDKNYQRIFAALGKHISWSIAYLLGERDARYEDVFELAKKNDNEVDPELIKTINAEIGDIQQHLSELIKLQPEIQKILTDLLAPKTLKNTKIP